MPKAIGAPNDRMCHACRLGCVLLAFVSVVSPVAWSDEETPEQVLKTLREACSTTPPFGVVAQQVQDLVTPLLGMGDAVVPLVVKEARESANGTPYQRQLLSLLVQNHSAVATDALFALTFLGPEKIGGAMFLSRRSISCAVPDNVYECLLQGLPGGAIDTNYYPEVLARCTAIPIEKRVTPLMVQFVSDIKRFCSASSESATGTLPAPPDRFVRAFHGVGEAALPRLREEYVRLPDECGQNWLRMAMAAAGDTSAADTVGEIVQHAPDLRTRLTAAYAYAHALKNRSVPLLSKVMEEEKGERDIDDIRLRFRMRAQILVDLYEYVPEFVNNFRKGHPPVLIDQREEAARMEAKCKAENEKRDAALELLNPR